MAELTFDKFHVIEVINAAGERPRREGHKTSAPPSHTRYLWLKSPEKLTTEQSARLEESNLKKCNRKTARVYHLKLISKTLTGPLMAVPLGCRKSATAMTRKLRIVKI